MTEKIVLVDEQDNQVGVAEKIKTHQEGKLHRAFSLFIFNSQGELLLQKRAARNYHSANLWSNTCCSHQRENEQLEEAALRRLKEEMGFICPLREAFRFTYRVEFENGLIENEFDHVFFGKFDGPVNPDSKEVADWKWITLEKLKKDIQKNPDQYSYWLKELLNRIISEKRNGKINS